MPGRNLDALQKVHIGLITDDPIYLKAYATDASVYREIPIGVAFPVDENDLIAIVTWAAKNKVSIVPRAGGTSLAGQVVGSGLIVDVSRHLNRILDFDVKERWVKVQPGVVLSQLNNYLKAHGLRFGPNTSTYNRCTIGGMVGNNSSGSGSIKYGTTRDHTLHIRAILSDSSVADFYGFNQSVFTTKCHGEQLENKLYRQIRTLLGNREIQQEIKERYPHPSIHRRNTGYALDSLIQSDPFQSTKAPFNMVQMLCGSEGTLCLFSEITLKVVPLPPEKNFLYIPHFNNLQDALKAVKQVMAFKPYACELVDKKIIECTQRHPHYSKLASFIKGIPEAILIIEFREDAIDTFEILQKRILHQFGSIPSLYDHVFISGSESEDVWKMRAAGLGLLANLPGNKKGVGCVEDTAVLVDDLPGYIRDFDKLLAKYNQESVYYAHAGAGELHLRPILDLRDEKDRKDFRHIATEAVDLVNKYRGSLSGEHGDGRVRSEFIPSFYGDKIYDLFVSIKKRWDPNNIFNPGKIIEAVKMDAALRADVTRPRSEMQTAFSFDQSGGMFEMVEKCNGSGDCRKTDSGTMCPTYMATRNEKDTTRARANMLREGFSNEKNILLDQEVEHVLGLCIGCKACLSECPSQIDMAKLKSEYLHQKQLTGSLSNRQKYYATIDQHYSKAYLLGKWSWQIFQLPYFEKKAREVLHIHHERSIPKMQFPTFYHWWKKEGKPNNPLSNKMEVILFCDEYTNYFEPEIGKAVVKLLQKLNYLVIIPRVKTSGRAAISKGYLRIAKSEAESIIKNFSSPSLKDRPIIGIEPSAILGFRDEYPELLRGEMRVLANKLKDRAVLFDEFIFDEMQCGRILESDFVQDVKSIHVHTHCHQKALSDEDKVHFSLSLPKNYSAYKIPSGCCGMAGSFGYEDEHYALSQKIGGLTLYPYIEALPASDIVVASGTSCRHQIRDGLQGKRSYHSAEVLFDALKR